MITNADLAVGASTGSDAGTAVIAFAVLGLPLSDIANLLAIVYLLVQMVEPAHKIVTGVCNWLVRRRKPHDQSH